MSLRPGAVNFDEKWRDLRETIDAVVHLKPVKRITWNDNISDIYALCVAFPKSFAETLYEHTRSLLEESVADLSNELLKLDSRSLLVRYHGYWTLYCQGAHYLDNLFSYFNRVHLNKYRPQDSLDYHVPGITLPPASPVDPNAPVEIRNMALGVWHMKMIDKIHDRLLVSLLSEIKKDRESQESHLSIVQDVIHSLIEVEEYNKGNELEYYQKVFEESFLRDTGNFYRQEAARLVADLSPSEYMQKAVVLLQNAKQRGEKFLHQSSMIKFIRECEARLVVDQMTYLQAYVPEMVQAERLSDLSNLFTLFSGIPKALEPVKKEFRAKVRQEGMSAVKSLLSSKDSPEVQEFMNVVLSIHRKYKKIAQTVFGEHKAFLAALDEGCKGFVNYVDTHQTHSQSPRLLARYCDQLLKKGSKGVGDNELEEKLDNAITVFQYIEDKDTFQKFYSRMLSRRLVFNNFSSMETEESMVQKLKYVCGYEYTARLQRMLVDMTLSSTLVSEFHDLKIKDDSLSIGFSTLVLQSGAWQLTQSPCPGVVMPSEFLKTLSKFESFYHTKYCGRCLSWLHHLALGELKLLYTKKTYLVTMTTFQLIIMMSFESSDSYTLSSLQRNTQLEMKELKSVVQSLVDAKFLLLNDKDSLSEDPVFFINLQYVNRRTKLKVSSLLQRETQQDIEQTHQLVLEDRKMFMQAAIVRVMKHRKTLKHNQLIEETILLIKHRFIPNIPLIKKCIEALIDKQYIERSSDSRDTYNYIA